MFIHPLPALYTCGSQNKAEPPAKAASEIVESYNHSVIPTDPSGWAAVDYGAITYWNDNSTNFNHAHIVLITKTIVTSLLWWSDFHDRRHFGKLLRYWIQWYRFQTGLCQMRCNKCLCSVQKVKYVFSFRSIRDTNYPWQRWGPLR